jgi:hypothetical protein
MSKQAAAFAAISFIGALPISTSLGGVTVGVE